MTLKGALIDACLAVFAVVGIAMLIGGIAQPSIAMMIVGLLLGAPGTSKLLRWAWARGRTVRVRLVAFAVAIPVMVLVISSLPAPSPRNSAEPADRPIVRDPLNIVPARLSGLRITAAWRVTVGSASQNLATYSWADGSPGEVTLSCAMPLESRPCEWDMPLRLTLGSTPACGSKRYDEYNGPLITWSSCELRVTKFKRRDPAAYERLRAAAVDAAGWTSTYSDTGSEEVYINNRAAGLLAASRVGNRDVPGLSGQLD